MYIVVLLAITLFKNYHDQSQFYNFLETKNYFVIRNIKKKAYVSKKILTLKRV